MKHRVLALALALLSLGACNPYLAQQSVAPPGRSARLDEVRGFWGLKRYRLQVSEGVAVAITCTEGGPCENLKLLSESSTIAEVRTASLAALQAQGFHDHHPQPASAFVIVGKSAGTTRVRVSAKEGSRVIDVTVVPPPAPPVPQTAAN